MPVHHYALADFLVGCVTTEIEAAQANGDEPAAHYLGQSRQILLAMRRDLDAEPHRSDEVIRYLYRTAVGYEGRPGFQSHWLLTASAYA